ncbi:coiled-coil domain-containing protein 63 isoform X1 [Monodelphis domestica]|uniref:coiled-coil domain-containing protein 63 isoform X1 n=1 Tax=Monodelphis domestica TaxID=13616 RepID=UPI00028BE700|nr:coiled-coil domain-containing protein 63 isoform X1 [Monodelphis domestica]XP_007489898.1 coiled-coil domain-containing protein 63 isoform X1 [Monodelphis domestica]
MLPVKQKRRRKASHENLEQIEKEKQAIAEAELQKLKQKFKKMVNNRRSFDVKSQHHIENQHKAISVLQAEQDEITLLLRLIRAPKNLELDDKNYTELKFLLQTKDEYDALIKAMKSLITELDDKIADIDNKIFKQKRTLAKMNEVQNPRKLRKQISVLETHLNQVTIQFDTMLTTNSKVRQNIEDLRFEKAAYDNVYQQLFRRLQMQRRTLNVAIEQSTQAYNQRLEALARISAMKDRRKKDISQFKTEMRELERIHDHEVKLKAFFLIKLMDRSDFEEQAKKEEALKASKPFKKSKIESFQSYEVAHMRLLKLSDYGNLDKLVDDFLAEEEKNFARFNYVSELNNDMEMLQKKIQNIQDEIHLLRSQKNDFDEEGEDSMRDLQVRTAVAT